MKYFFYLLLLSFIFSLGMYIGIDRSSTEMIKEISEDLPAEETVINRDKIIEEIEENQQQVVAAADIEPSILHSVANGGEKVVKKNL